MNVAEEMYIANTTKAVVVPLRERGKLCFIGILPFVGGDFCGCPYILAAGDSLGALFNRPNNRAGKLRLERYRQWLGLSM
jgi:hypothetical protein